jgi:hypothetical protein
VTLFTAAALTAADLVLTAGGGDIPFTDGPQNTANLKSFACQPGVALTTWQLQLGAQTTPVDRVWLVVRYTLGGGL